MSSDLALHGGDPAVTIREPEQWERPVEEEKRAVNALIEDGFLSGAGRGLPLEFEETFAEFTGADYCLTVTQGSTGLASAYYAVGVGPGDEVITSAAGYIGAYAGALHLGARPVFCEVDPETLNPDPADIESRITDRTAAINVTHWNGRACDMDALLDIRDEYDVPIVEDAAHAHGTHWDGEHIGNVGDITCFSLQGVAPSGKPLAAGEGGVVTTNDREYYERQLAYCHLHRSGVTEELTLPPYDGLDAETLGRKWRAHPLAIAIANVEFESLEYRCRRRVENRKHFFGRLADVPGVRPAKTYAKSDSGGFYGGLRIVLEPEEVGGLDPERFVEALDAEGAPVRGPGFPHLEHRRAVFADGFDLWGGDRGPLGGEFCGLPPYEPPEPGDFPVTEDLHGRVVSLASYIDPKDGFLDQYARAVEKVVENRDQLR